MDANQTACAPEARAYDLVLAYIKGEIAAGELKLGDKLPSERALMTRLSLSRNSVREALRQLENMGFVRSVHGQGSFLVNEAGRGFAELFSMLLLLHQTDRQEFWELRRCLETSAFAAAAAAPDSACLAEMEQAVEQMEQAGTLEQLEQAEEAFHRALLACSGNRLFRLIQNALAAPGQTYRRETLTTLDEPVRAPLCATHRRILESLRTGRTAAGLAALEEHFKLIR